MSEAKHKNEAHIAGELTKDPVTRFTPTGKKISTLTIVTKFKQWSEYHRVVCWEEAAEKAEKLTKGEFVKIVGRLQNRSWQDKQTGQKKYSTEIVAFQVVGPGEEQAEKAETFPDGSLYQLQDLPNGQVEMQLITGERFVGDPLEVSKRMAEAQVRTKRWSRQKSVANGKEIARALLRPAKEASDDDPAF